MRRPRILFAAAAFALVACSDVAHVERITFVNNGVFPATVAVSDRGRSGWVDLGIAPANEETAFEEVIDQGQTWVFRFEYAGKHQEELEVPRADLEREGWSLEVPAEFEKALRELGVSPLP